MGTIENGSRVRSLVNAQGMTRGECFEVVASSVFRTFVGGFVTYQLRSIVNGREVSVGNGHLVLEVMS